MDTSRFPVEEVSWEDAVEFCRRLSSLPGEEPDDWVYRLPTEAEWEYACRAGTTTQFYFRSPYGKCNGGQQWGVNLGRTTTVGSYPGNAFGLYDMYGNVWEWCLDWWGQDYYRISPLEDPAGPFKGTERVVRGGGFGLALDSGSRFACHPSTRCLDIGFRVARSPATRLALSLHEAQQKPAEWASFQAQFTNSIGVTLVLISAGRSWMSSPQDDKDAHFTEKPQHEIVITNPFYLGVTEVTQGQYEVLTGENPSHFKGDPQRPVESVSWEDAVAFCRKLSEKESRLYRLPTEAEWEYACRAGSQTKWFWRFGDSHFALSEHAWYSEDAYGSTHPVAQKKPNAWGIYDMYRNVGEWCSDLAGGPYGASFVVDPTGPTEGSNRVVRGGNWGNDALSCRSASRSFGVPGYRGGDIGFRVVSVPREASSK